MTREHETEPSSSFAVLLVRPRRWLSLTVAVTATALLTLTACGSTVTASSALRDQSTSEASGDGLSLNPDLTSPSTAPSATGPTSTSSGADPSAPSALPSFTPEDGPSSGTSSPTLPGKGANAAKQPLTIGLITSGNGAALFSSLGVNLNFGDQRAQAALITGYLNKKGGLLGHPLKVVSYDYDTSLSAVGNAQAACAAFTQDNHAFAVIGVAGMDDSFHECAHKAGVLVLADGDMKATSFFKRFPTTIEISEMDLTRKYRGLVNGLNDLGFFTKGAKLGILRTIDPNDAEGVRNGMRPALAALGLKVTDEIAIDQSAAATGTAQIANAVLRLRSDGVTHIVFAQGSAYVFAIAAQQQGYYPFMGIESRQSPALVMQTTNSSQSLSKVWGIGYQPIQDVDASRDPGPVSSRQTLCKKLLDGGQQGWGSNRTAMGTALYICDELFFLDDVFSKASDLSRQSFLDGVAGLGTKYLSALTFSTRFSSSQHDGASSWRPLRFSSDCKCFSYVGSARPFKS